MPFSHAARYWIPTETFWRTPASVTSPGVSGTDRSCSAVTETSGRCRSSWFGPVSTRSNSSVAGGTRSGWATQVPSNPSPASRALSSCTFASAVSVTSASRRLGMNAAIPPIAKAPRLWHVFTSNSVYARMNGAVIEIEFRSGSRKS